MSANPTPTAGLDITEVEDGLVVFVPSTRMVHHLDVNATLIFLSCNGEHDESSIAELVRTAFGLPAAPLDEVRSTLELFRSAGIIEHSLVE